MPLSKRFSFFCLYGLQSSRKDKHCNKWPSMKCLQVRTYFNNSQQVVNFEFNSEDKNVPPLPTLPAVTYVHKAA